MAITRPKSFFIATPIFYVNDVPHIGHAYTEVAADALSRWMRQSGIDTWFLTGTDEHGQKIMRTAMANGVSPKEWADRLVEQAWKPLLATLNLANDDFIRTTEERHESAVTKFLTLLHDKGFIYQGEYEGFYCVGCEEYKAPGDLHDGQGEYEGQKVCEIHGRPVEVLKEENYFFKMSDFQERLLELYRDQPDFIQPASVRNEIIAFVTRGLDDLSISRSNIDWGIEVPFDSRHVTYVWFEALLNYITATGWGSDEANFDSEVACNPKAPASDFCGQGETCAYFESLPFYGMMSFDSVPLAMVTVWETGGFKARISSAKANMSAR
jgi:methionyl-tRNA synthetase